MKKIISGKVREVYDLEDGRMVIVTTDRLSAFDVILPTPVRGKGKVLNALSEFWFGYTEDIIENHMISSDINDMPDEFKGAEYEGRTILVKKLKMLDYEFVVRGYIFGNMWEAYKKDGCFCGQKLEPGYRLAEKLREPILTPSTKASEGHDIYVGFDTVENALGKELAGRIKNISIRLYEKCYEHAYKNGIIIADTKFEFGIDENGGLVLADEIFTPDSSRFWSLEEYKIGESPKSYDKQFIRDWLIANGLNGVAGIDSIPEDVIENTENLYNECLEKITR